jgi:hypothetical protein
MTAGKTADGMPVWVPEGARHYLAHTERGHTIRALARQADVHASTILRQVRRIEAQRDDPLVDRALRRLSQLCAAMPPPRGPGGRVAGHRNGTEYGMMGSGAGPGMTGATDEPMGKGGHGAMPGAEEIEREGFRILRRLAEAGTVLAVARDMEIGVVVRDGGDGDAPQRLAVVDRAIAEAMALNDWIGCDNPEARVARYRITGAGRAELKRMVAAAENRARGFCEAQAALTGALPEDPALRHMRSMLGESPLVGLARRHDRDGQPFLSRDLIAAAERLREDFELSLTGPGGHAAWEAFLLAAVEEGTAAPMPQTGGAAGERVRAALEALGPGLADVALRCCCLLEGLESLERRMGWSARSGKVVLRIALQRLNQHYLRTQGRFGPLIG